MTPTSYNQAYLATLLAGAVAKVILNIPPSGRGFHQYVGHRRPLKVGRVTADFHCGHADRVELFPSAILWMILAAALRFLPYISAVSPPRKVATE